MDDGPGARRRGSQPDPRPPRPLRRHGGLRGGEGAHLPQPGAGRRRGGERRRSVDARDARRRPGAAVRLHPAAGTRSARGHGGSRPSRPRAGSSFGFAGGPARGSANRALRGAHNLANAMAAALLAFHAGVRPDALQAGLDGFPGLPHRLESVRTLDGVEWVNDSKATNVDAVLTALDAPSRPAAAVAHRRRQGEGRALRARWSRPRSEKSRGCSPLGRMPVSSNGSSPPCALFTPARRSIARCCARAPSRARATWSCSRRPARSYDQFRNFEHRGDTFRALVEAL